MPRFLLYISFVDHLRVLVIDDEESMRLAVSRSLKDFSVSVDQIGEKVAITIEEASSAASEINRRREKATAATRPAAACDCVRCYTRPLLRFVSQVQDLVS
jgi:hypothetical protein